MFNYLVGKRDNVFDLFNGFFPEAFYKPEPTMRADIKEGKDVYLLDIELPGLNKDDIKVSVDDGYLTITAMKKESKEEENTKYISREIRSSKQSRSFYVGNIDESKINASFNNGILSISIPKEMQLQEETKKYIEIK